MSDYESPLDEQKHENTTKTVPHTRVTVKGDGFDAATGGFADLLFDGERWDAQRVAACVNSHDRLVNACEKILECSKYWANAFSGEREALKLARAALAAAQPK